MQGWESDGRTTPPRYDIAPRTGYWSVAENRWAEKVGRHAHLYVFAWHGNPGENDDQRDPAQWVFHVIAERDLPDQKSIGLNVLRGMVPSCDASDLQSAVETVASAATAKWAP